MNPDLSNQICNYSSEGTQTVKASVGTISPADFSYSFCDCVMTVSAKDTNDTVVSSIFGGVSASPSDYSYWLWGNLTNGTGSLRVQSDTELQYSAYIDNEDYVASEDVTATCEDGEGSVNFVMVPTNSFITGGFVDGDGEVVTLGDSSSLSVYATKGSVYRKCPNDSSSFTCTVSAGNWCIGYWPDPSSGFAASSAGATTSCMEVGDSETISQPLTFLRTATINATVQNPDGSGRPDVYVLAAPFSNSQYGGSDEASLYMPNGCMTDEDGTCEIPVGAAASPGTTYYLNAYVPNDVKSDEGLMNPAEITVTAIEGESVEADPLVFRAPDGTISLTLIYDPSSEEPTLMIAGEKRVVISEDDSDVSPITNATVDCFSENAFFETTAEDGNASCPCMTGENWQAAAYAIVGSTLWMSDVTEVTCSAEGGVDNTLTMNDIGTLPDPVSVTNTDPANTPMAMETSDGASFSIAAGGVATDGTVTCSMAAAMPPLTANARPTTFGYSISCQYTDDNGNTTPVTQLNDNATFCLPLDEAQINNVGLDCQSVNADYYDTSTGSWSGGIVTSMVDCEEDIVCFQQNHLTNFAVVGNTNLAGLTQDGVGDDGNETAGDEESGGTATAAAGGCGCRMSGEPTSSEQVAWPVMILAMATVYGLAKKSRRHISQKS